MFNLLDLITAVKSKITATTALLDLAGRVAFAEFAEGTENPKARISLVGDSVQGAFGNQMISTVQLQVSVFANSLAAACNLQKGLVDAFNASTLTLASGTLISARLVEGRRLLAEAQKPSGFIYHSIVVVEFRVLN